MTGIDIWKNYILPALPKEALKKLFDAATADDGRLIRGINYFPPPSRPRSKITHCDIVGFAFVNFGTTTVEELGQKWGNFMLSVGDKLGNPHDLRHFLNWYDDSPREVVLDTLAKSIEPHL